jgi:glycosyltransferase involved in cell wall biosynthesis
MSGGAGVPACSVLVPSYNDGPKLARCLDSLLRLEEPEGGWELVLVLDGSTDGSREMLARGLGAAGGGPLDDLVAAGAWAGLPLHLIELSANRGRSAARNAALAAAAGEWLLFLDADLRVGSGWARALREGQRERNHVAVGGMVYVIEDAAGRRLPLKRYQRYLQTRGPYKYRARDEMPARYFYTCNASVHRSLIEAAGGFDEGIVGWGGEDIDMGLRLGAAGARLRYCAPAVAEHAQERSFASHCANLRTMGREILPRLFARHPGLASDLSLPRLEEGLSGAMLRAAIRLGLPRLLLAWEAATDGLGFSDRIYDLTAFLHYGAGYREHLARRGASGGAPSQGVQT